MTMTQEATETRIYVASLSDYNAGELHGVWITLPADDLHEQVAAMLAASPTARREGSVAEEHAIHDSEGLGAVGEYDDLDELNGLADVLNEHGGAYLAYRTYEGSGATHEGFTEAYAGEYDSIEDYAREFIDDTGMLAGIPDTIAQYFDYEAYARDLELGGAVWTADAGGGCVWIFYNS